jgi:hypothetical protein
VAGIFATGELKIFEILSEIIKKRIPVLAWEMLWNLAMQTEGKDLNCIHVYH